MLTPGDFRPWCSSDDDAIRKLPGAVLARVGLVLIVDPELLTSVLGSQYGARHVYEFYNRARISCLRIHCEVNGGWTENALNQFRDFLTWRGFRPSGDELITILRCAKEKYLDGPGCLSIVRRSRAATKSASISRMPRWKRRVPKPACRSRSRVVRDPASKPGAVTSRCRS